MSRDSARQFQKCHISYQQQIKKGERKIIIIKVGGQF